jgi:hypothetical protein
MGGHRIIIHLAKSKSGELGASAIRANVDVSGYPTSNFTVDVMKNTITNLLKNNGWGVYSVSISVLLPSNLFYISVVILAVRNTADELEKIKQGVGNVLRTVLPLRTIEASFAGSAARQNTIPAKTPAKTPKVDDSPYVKPPPAPEETIWDKLAAEFKVDKQTIQIGAGLLFIFVLKSKT